jgi:hypothetical protein
MVAAAVQAEPVAVMVAAAVQAEPVAVMVAAAVQVEPVAVMVAAAVQAEPVAVTAAAAVQAEPVAVMVAVVLKKASLISVAIFQAVDAVPVKAIAVMAAVEQQVAPVAVMAAVANHINVQKAARVRVLVQVVPVDHLQQEHKVPEHVLVAENFQVERSRIVVASRHSALPKDQAVHSNRQAIAIVQNNRLN